jgi:hypothetical protein
MKNLLLFAFAILTFFPLHAFSDEPITNGEDLIRQMNSRYADSWYKHLTFKQNMFRYKNDSLVRNEIWLVAYSAPSKLHIRYNDFSSGRGWLVVNDTLYSFNHSKLIGKRPRLHELVILGYDVYAADPAVIIPKIKAIGFDFSQVEIVEIKGKEYYQVGDYNEMCFFVGKDDLLFFGVRRVDENGVKETFYHKYKEFYGKQVATEVQYYENGQMYLYEKYFDIRLPSCMPADFFTPKLFNETRW